MMRSATVGFSLLSLLCLSASVRATWVTVRLNRSPMDAGRYSIAVSHERNSMGGIRFHVRLKLKQQPWPMQIIAMLTKVKVQPHSLESAEMRRLNFVTHGDVRTCDFDVSRREAGRWHFQLDEYGESEGRLMPGTTSYLFPLNRPPVINR